MSKGKAVWLDQEIIDWLDSQRVGDESYTSVLRRLLLIPIRKEAEQ